MRQSDEVAANYFLKIDLAAAGKLAAPCGHEHQAVLAEQESLDIVRQSMLGGKPEIRSTGRNRRGNIRAFPLLDIDVDVGMLPQKRRKRLRQMLGQTRGVGEQVNAGFGAACVSREIAAHR